MSAVRRSEAATGDAFPVAPISTRRELMRFMRGAEVAVLATSYCGASFSLSFESPLSAS